MLFSGYFGGNYLILFKFSFSQVVGKVCYLKEATVAS